MVARLLLSLDGGGVRGVITTTILSLIEKEILRGRVMAEITSAVAGTSAGAINAGFIAQKTPMKHVLRGPLSHQELGQTFQKTFMARIPLLGKLFQQYRGEPKWDQLHDFFGDQLVHHCDIKILIPTLDWTVQSPGFFHNFSSASDFVLYTRLCDAIHASSSPPYYLPCFQITDARAFMKNPNSRSRSINTKSKYTCPRDAHLYLARQEFPNDIVIGEPQQYPIIRNRAAPNRTPKSGDFFCDGGLATNTPDITLFGMARKEWPEDDLFVLSIGTGYSFKEATEEYKPYQSNVVGLVSSGILNTIMDAPDGVNVIDSSLIVNAANPNSKRYLRIDEALPPGFDMDIFNLSEYHIECLQDIGIDWFEKYRDELFTFLNPFVIQ